MADVGSFLDFSWFVWVWLDCGFALVGCFGRVGFVGFRLAGFVGFVGWRFAVILVFVVGVLVCFVLLGCDWGFSC